jgi:DNA-directed RNA polymerase subunit K/omega
MLSVKERIDMVHRPAEISAFEFVVLSGLRTAQLIRGCTPHVKGDHKRITIAQLEVASGQIVRAPITITGAVVI